jgi:regulator of protease activity HflC (stomatin/prohibitin superfamily)
VPWLVITIILGLIGGIALIVGMSNRKEVQGSGATFGAYAIFGLALLVWLIATVALSIHTVGQRQVGVVKNFSGTITGKVDPGIAWTAPWQSIDKQDTGILREEFDLGPNNSAVSKDQQPIFSRTTLNYQVLPADVVGLWKKVGPSWKETLLDSRVLQDFKEVTSKYTAQEITTRREQLRSETKGRLESELGRYDIRVVDFFVKNIDYSNAYAEAIDAKNRQVQAALQAEAKVAQSKAEANQAAAVADGQRRAAISRAEGNAKSIALEGKALRNNPEVIRLRAIEKLNPNAQVVICTGTTCPSFLPLSALNKGG